MHKNKFWKLFDLVNQVTISAIQELANHVPVMMDMEQMVFELFERLFHPKQIVDQIITILILQLSVMTFQSVTSYLSNSLNVYFFEKDKQISKILSKLKKVNNYNDWKSIALEYDTLNQLDKWRESSESSLVDCSRLRRRTQSTLEMIKKKEKFNLMFRLRGGITRDQFGLQHEGLYSRALSGTKRVIEEYHEAVTNAFEFICDHDDHQIPIEAKLSFFNEMRHSYGRTAILLSGGAYLGYYHVGVVKTLIEEGLLPRVIAGASAGSLTAVFIGTRTDQEYLDALRDMNDPNETPSKQTVEQCQSIPLDFFKKKEKITNKIGRKIISTLPLAWRPFLTPLLIFLLEGKLLNFDTEHFVKRLKESAGDYTFQEAFDRTGRIVNITVAPLNNYDPPRLLNYLTAPHVCLWSAAAASCALPGIFDSIPLIVKEPNGTFTPEHTWTKQKEGIAYYSDGSLESDLPMERLSELFNINHFIVSQVNIQSTVLSSTALRASIWSHPVYGALAGYIQFLKNQCRDWLKNMIRLLTHRSNSPIWQARRGLSQTLTQDYEPRDSDVMIVPWIGHLSVFKAMTSIVKNPTISEYKEIIKVSQANTWPSISRIRAHCQVEMTLDKCVQNIRYRLSQKSTVAMQSKRSHESNLDRTPSFFTTRSILNISGLSVSDPMPLCVTNQENPREAIEKYSNENPYVALPSAVDSTALESNSKGAIDQMAQYLNRKNSIDQTVLKGSGIKILHKNDSFETRPAEMNEHDDMNDNDFIKLNVILPSIPFPLGDNEETCQVTSKPGEEKETTLEDDITVDDSSSIVTINLRKNISMSNFYYGKESISEK